MLPPKTRDQLMQDLMEAGQLGKTIRYDHTGEHPVEDMYAKKALSASLKAKAEEKDLQAKKDLLHWVRDNKDDLYEYFTKYPKNNPKDNDDYWPDYAKDKDGKYPYIPVGPNSERVEISQTELDVLHQRIEQLESSRKSLQTAYDASIEIAKKSVDQISKLHNEIEELKNKLAAAEAKAAMPVPSVDPETGKVDKATRFKTIK